MRKHCKWSSTLLKMGHTYTSRPDEVTEGTPKNIVEEITADIDKNLAWGSGDAGFGLTGGSVIRRWLQLGRDPVVNAPISRTKEEFKECRQMSREDMLGTDISSEDPMHKEHSRNFWKRIIKDKALAKMRQESTGSADVGKLTFNSLEKRVEVDPVDREETRWEDDLNFSRCTQTCEAIFGTKPRNMRDFETVIESATADQLFEFWNGAKSQLENQSQSLLGLSSLTFYEGMELKDYCQRIKPLNDLRKDFVALLISDVSRCGGWSVVAVRLARAYENVNDIIKQRRTRLIDENKIKSWRSMNDDEQINFCLSEREICERRILDGNFDPESSFVCAQWKKENELIQEIMSKKIPGCSFTLQTFWDNYERVNEMQREHMYTTHANKLKFAMCFKRVRNELNGNEDKILDATLDSLRKSTFDLGNGVLTPHMSDIWCKLNWPFYGSTGYRQNTINGRRSYLFHHGTPSQVKAIALAYYSTRPLSESIDYSSPYTFRQSHANILADAGVQAMEDRQRASTSAEAYCEWEEDLASVVLSAKARMGKVRRRYQEHARKAFHSGMEGELISEITVSPRDVDGPIVEWIPGTISTVSFRWNPPEIEPSSSMATQESIARAEYNTRNKCRIEVSLWRKKMNNDVSEEYSSQMRAQDICKKTIMKDVSQYTLWFYRHIANNPECLDSETRFLNDFDLHFDESQAVIDNQQVLDDSEHQQWSFAAMLDDNIELTESNSYLMTLPYAHHDLSGKYTSFPKGEYRIRVRGFRYETNPNRHPVRCVQEYSKPFQVEDKVFDQLNEFLSGNEASNGFLLAHKLPSVVNHLRSLNFEISVDTEFLLGQKITPGGEISLEYIIDTLRSGEGWKNPCRNGIADDELAAETTLFRRFEELNPGATIDEWMSARRAVFKKAFTGKESAWWIEDDLETEEVSMHNLNEPVWYIHDKITSLSATGAYSLSPGDPLIESEIEGSGTITQLAFNKKSEKIDINTATQALLGSLQNAHTRLNFLAQGKLSPLLEKIHLCIADREYGYNGFASWGGKYLRTLYFCYNAAQRNLRSRMSSVETMIRYKAIKRWGSTEYKFRTEKPTQEYRLGPHEALTTQDTEWPK